MQGTGDIPRLSVYRSNRSIYAQLIDDSRSHTLAATSSRALGDSGASIVQAKKVGAAIAKEAQARSIQRVVFDRSGYLYHGRVKALAEAARAEGLTF